MKKTKTFNSLGKKGRRGLKQRLLNEPFKIIKNLLKERDRVHAWKRKQKLYEEIGGCQTVCGIRREARYDPTVGGQ